MTAISYRFEEELTSAPTHPIPDPSLPSNLYRADRHLQNVLARYLHDEPTRLAWAAQWLDEWGRVCSQEIAPLVSEADRHEPTLRQFDRRGDRVDELIFHPAYHEIGRLAYGGGLASMSNRDGFRGFAGRVPQLLKTAGFYLYSQVEGSISCPLSMTDTLARVLNMYAGPELIERYGPGLTSLDYDKLYTGAMFMTEKVGGSDVGATTTTARHDPDGGWRLNGDKWFCSNVGADLILTLARPLGGVSGTRGLGLFLVPRVLPDGQRNSYVINRLKDKLGTRAMASGEVTFVDTTAYLIEPLDRGFVMMMEMVNGTRLASGMGGAAALRRAVIEAVQHAQARHTFGRPLAQQPLMAEGLADLVADSQATTSLLLAAAHELDRADQSGTASQKLLARLLISLVKRYATSHGVQGAQTALEIRGGNGYIEDWPNARLLRDAYVQIIWEGGVNMVSFDVLRTLDRENSWPVYTAMLEGELSNIHKPELTGLVAELRQDMARLGELVQELMAQNRPAQEIAAPALAEALAGLGAATLLAAQADFDWRTSASTLSRASAERYHVRFCRPLLHKLSGIVGRPVDLIGPNELIEGAL